jgi:hypothetical protein
VKSRWVPVIAAAGLLLSANIAAAQTLRSDSPLWTYDGGPTELYPRNFVDDEGFGCVHATRTGIWRYVPTDDPELTTFWRLENYGVNHCALLFGVASHEDGAATAFEDYAWMVRLGDAATEPNQSELWVLQIGVAGGSRYELLRRQFGKAEFDVLEARCPREAERRRAQIDVWSQDDCIVRSQSEMTSVAIAASRHSPKARLKFIPPKVLSPVP